MEMQVALSEIGIDYPRLLNRFVGNTTLLRRFLNRFLEDPTFTQLEEYARSADYAKLEIAAQTLKGLTANLGMEGLSQTCMDLLEAIRQGSYSSVPQLFAQVEARYRAVIAVISQIHG